MPSATDSRYRTFCDVMEPNDKGRTVVCRDKDGHRRKVRSRGMCTKHLKRWERSGGLNGGSPLHLRKIICQNPECPNGENGERARISKYEAIRSGPRGVPFCSRDCRFHGKGGIPYVESFRLHLEGLTVGPGV